MDAIIGLIYPVCTRKIPAEIGGHRYGVTFGQDIAGEKSMVVVAMVGG